MKIFGLETIGCMSIVRCVIRHYLTPQILTRNFSYFKYIINIFISVAIIIQYICILISIAFSLTFRLYFTFELQKKIFVNHKLTYFKMVSRGLIFRL